MSSFVQLTRPMSVPPGHHGDGIEVWQGVLVGGATGAAHHERGLALVLEVGVEALGLLQVQWGRDHLHVALDEGQDEGVGPEKEIMRIN